MCSKDDSSSNEEHRERPMSILLDRLDWRPSEYASNLEKLVRKHYRGNKDIDEVVGRVELRISKILRKLVDADSPKGLLCTVIRHEVFDVGKGRRVCEVRFPDFETGMRVVRDLGLEDVLKHSPKDAKVFRGRLSGSKKRELNRACPDCEIREERPHHVPLDEVPDLAAPSRTSYDKFWQCVKEFCRGKSPERIAFWLRCQQHTIDEAAALMGLTVSRFRCLWEKARRVFVKRYPELRDLI